MNRLTSLALLLSLLLCAAPSAEAAPTTFTGGHDIKALMEEARRTWDFADHDAVILLEEAGFSWLSDGRVREEHHRVVWISTDHTLDAFADLRVPWDSDHQTFTVEALRVWRDNRWIEARPTAVVETTPDAFRLAPDYTGIRETMLLHDGVELPCILECVYIIEDKAPFRTGMEGQWIFPQDEPTLDCRLTVETPAGSPLVVKASPYVIATEDGGARHFGMKNLDPAPYPPTDDPAAYLPHVQWSTYPGWAELGVALTEGFTAGLVLDDALRDSLVAAVKGTYSSTDRAHAVIDFVGRSQRRLDYAPAFFMNRVRRAARIFDTGYAVDMDLAILTGALLRGAGFETALAFLGRGYGAVDEGVATLARFGGPGLWVRGDGLEAYYDPSSGALFTGLSAAHGRMVWVPGGDRLPRAWGAHDDPTHLIAALDLRWNAEEKTWTGHGYYEAQGGLSPYDGWEGRGRNTPDDLGRAMAEMFGGLTVDGFSPVEITPGAVSAHLEVTAPAAERDDLDRLAVVMGAPGGGLRAALPPDVHLYLAERGSPVRLAGAAAQKITLTLDLGDLEVVRLPEPARVENAAGRFELAVTRDGNEVTVIRTLTLAMEEYPASEWAALRALLLAETHDANRTLMFK